MSSSITASSLTTAAATGTAASSASTTSTSSTSSASSSASTLTQLAGNFNDFLQLLTTQLKNQDPTSPLDTNQFTSQLVQFTSVAEQISTNTTLGQLLTSSLAQQLTQASDLVGQSVKISGGTLPLQNGSAQVDFQTTTDEPVQIAVSDSNGNVVQTATVNAASGSNTWTWDGTTSSGGTAPNGNYTAAVTSSGATVPFQTIGTVTGAQQTNQTVQLMFGTSGVSFNNIVSFGKS